MKSYQNNAKPHAHALHEAYENTHANMVFFEKYCHRIVIGTNIRYSVFLNSS